MSFDIEEQEVVDRSLKNMSEKEASALLKRMKKNRPLLLKAWKALDALDDEIDGWKNVLSKAQEELDELKDEINKVKRGEARKK